ncbi:MAG: B12-binding domain-containing radical SAM protein, partial [Kiritimatiellae bacterium]|nr:B12-binding domain-containing radical SAM protein [Kiritimatiellia bacterium]
MKIAIAYPPIASPKGVPLLSQNRQFQWFNRPTFIYPVVPACAATTAKQAGHEVFWLDGIAERWTEERFLEEVLRAAPDLMLIETKTPVVRTTWHWVERLKARLPAMRIALAGDHVTALPAESMANCPADFVLTGGDFDFLLLNLLRHLERGEPLETGIWFRDVGGAARSSGPFVTHHDLGALPPIDRDLTRWELYSVHNGNYRRTPGAYIMAGRDCWHGKCTFCSWTT